MDWIRTANWLWEVSKELKVEGVGLISISSNGVFRRFLSGVGFVAVEGRWLA
jgi:hypothetical protein